MTESNKAPVVPDCRVCRNFIWQKLRCMSVAQCINGDCYKPSEPVYLWTKDKVGA